MRCEAITKKGTQCKFGNRCTIPNIIGGGPQKDNTQKPWRYGRAAHVCLKHHRKYQKLINGGFLQPYNKYGFGNIILNRFINFNDETGEPIGEYNLPDFWMK